MLGLVLLVLFGGLLLFFFFGPREPVVTTLRFDPAHIGSNPEAYLAASEAKYDDIREGLQKEIIWHDPDTKQQTDLAIIYLHGFSSSKVETRPVPDRVARALGANLFLTRLTGHGRRGSAMAEATAQDWLDDTAEAIEIGRRIGKRVLILSTSTGGTAAAFAAQHGDLARDVAGIVFISPNFGVNMPGADMVNMPWARMFVPMMLGPIRDVSSTNPEYEYGWTTRYPTTALIPMTALVQHVRALPFAGAAMPALFMHAPDDQVVKPSESRKIMQQWGGPTAWIDVNGTRGPTHHVIAGDIVNPEKTDEAVAHILGWAETHLAE